MRKGTSAYKKIFYVVLTILVHGILFCAVYLLYIAVIEEKWLLVWFWFGVIIAGSSLSSIMLNVSKSLLALQRYRQTAKATVSLTNTMANALHPVEDTGGAFLTMESGARVYIDYGVLWGHLIDDESSARRSVLARNRYIDELGLQIDVWRAYREALKRANVVTELKSGELRLTVAPWRAVEAVKENLSRGNVRWWFHKLEFWWNKKIQKNIQ